MANLSEALASKISGSINKSVSGFMGGIKGSFMAANPAGFAAIGGAFAGIEKALTQQTKESKKEREERRKEKAFDEEKSNEQKKLFTDILSELKEVNENLKKLLKSFTDKEKSPFKEMLTALGAMLAQFLKDFGDKVGKLIDFLADLFKGLRSSIDDLLKGLKAFFDRIKSGFDDFERPKFIDDIMRAIKNIFDDIARGLKLAFDDLKSLFSKIKTPSFVDDLIKSLKLNFDDLLRGLKLFIDDFKLKFKTGLEDLAKFLRFEDIADVLRRFKTDMAVNLAVLSDELSDLGKLIKTQFSKIGEVFTSKIDDVLRTVGESKIGKAISELFERITKFLSETFQKISIGGVGSEIKAIDAVADSAKVAENAGILAKLIGVFKGFSLTGPAFKWLAETMDVAAVARGVLKIAGPLSAIISIFDGLKTALFEDTRLARNLEKSVDQLNVIDRLGAFVAGFLGSFFGIFDLLLDVMNIDLGDTFTATDAGPMKEKRSVQRMVTDFLTKNVVMIFNGIKTLLELFGKVLTSEPAMALYSAVGALAGAIIDRFKSFIDFFKDILFSEPMLKIYEVLGEAIKKSAGNAVDLIKGVIDLFIGIISFDWAAIKRASSNIYASLENQVKNAVSAIADIFRILSTTMVEFIEDGINWVINQLPAWIRPKPLDLTGKYKLTAADRMDEEQGIAMSAAMRGGNLTNAQVRAGVISPQQAALMNAIQAASSPNQSAGDIANIRQAYADFARQRRTEGKSFITLPEFEEAMKNGMLDALHQRRSPSAMDLLGQNARYSRDQYDLSKQYYRSDLDYQRERAGLQDQFNNNMIQMYRQSFTNMMGPMGLTAPTARAGYNIANQQEIVRGFIKSGTNIFGDQMGAPMAYIFNTLAGNYLDQFISNTMAPALGMNAGQLNRSINNLLASRQFRPQLKAVEKELAESRNQLTKLEKDTGFSMAELIKAGSAGGFDQGQQQRYLSLVNLRQQISQREQIYGKLKEQEKKYKDMAIEDFIFGISGVPTGIRSFLGYEQGLNNLAISLGMMTAAPFAPIFGTGPMGGFGGMTGGGTRIMYPGMTPGFNPYAMGGGAGMGMPYMPSPFNPYAGMGGFGGMGGGPFVPTGPYMGSPGFVPTFPGEMDVISQAYGVGRPAGSMFMNRTLPAMVPLLSYALTRQIGNKLGVKGILGNMALMTTAMPVVQGLLGSLQMFGGAGLGSFSVTGALSNALGLQGITSATTGAQLLGGVGGAVNNLLGGGIVPGLAGLISGGGTSLLNSAIASGAYGPAGLTSIGGQLGAGMVNFGAGMTAGTQSLAGFSSAMSTGGANAAGAIAGSALGGLSAYGLSKGLSGGYQISKNFDYIVGMAAMIPGLAPFAPLIGLGGAALNRLFGRKAREYTDYGIQGTIGEEGVNLEQYKNWFEKGGRYRSDRSGTDLSGLDQESINAIQGAVGGRTQLARDYGAILGYGEEAAAKTRTFSQQIKMSLKGLDEQGMVGAFRQMITSFSDDMIKSIYVGVDKFRIGNEELLQTMQNLASSTAVFDEAMRQLGFGADELSATFRSKTLVDLAGFKQQLIGTFGGDTLDQQRQNFAKVIGTYFDIMYTETEKNQYVMDLNQRKLAEQTRQISNSLASVQAKIPDQVKGITEFSKVLTEENMIDVEKTLRKNYDNFRAVVEELNKIDETSALTMMGAADEFDAALKSFLNIELEKQKTAQSTENVVKDIVEPFKNYVDVVGSTVKYEGGYDFGMFSGTGNRYVDSPVTPIGNPSFNVAGNQGFYGPVDPRLSSSFGDLITSGVVSLTPASGTLGFLSETNMTSALTAGTAGGQGSPLFIDNSVTSSSSSPTTIVMNDDKIRDYHPILNSSERTLTYGYSLARS